MELGCDSGAFMPLIACMVGGEGKMYALDIESDMLRQLESKLSMPENRDIKNVRLFEVTLMDCRSKIAIWT